MLVLSVFAPAAAAVAPPQPAAPTNRQAAPNVLVQPVQPVQQVQPVQPAQPAQSASSTLFAAPAPAQTPAPRTSLPAMTPANQLFTPAPPTHTAPSHQPPPPSQPRPTNTFTQPPPPAAPTPSMQPPPLPANSMQPPPPVANPPNAYQPPTTNSAPAPFYPPATSNNNAYNPNGYQGNASYPQQTYDPYSQQPPAPPQGRSNGGGRPSLPPAVLEPGQPHAAVMTPMPAQPPMPAGMVRALPMWARV